jgi:ATP phosphoribosyltransferase regulatory subunit HisZ
VTNTITLREDLKRAVDAIEGGYELMLAYAAQGLPKDQASQSGGQLREALSRFDDALTGLAETCRQIIAVERPDQAATYDAFLDVLAQDAYAAQAAIRVVRAQTGISSLLVDNLNASVHVRALLTDLFVIDEALK